MGVATDDPLDLPERWEPCRRKWRQRPLFYLREDLGDLLARCAVNPVVRHPRLPIEQMHVLLLQAGERLALQGVALGVAHLALDLSLVTRCARLGRQDARAVVFGEGLNLRVQIGVKPIGLEDSRFEVVDNEGLGNAAKLPEGILDAREERFGRLPVDHLALRLPRVTQNDAEEMRTFAFAVWLSDGRPGAEVDLGLLAGSAFHPPER